MTGIEYIEEKINQTRKQVTAWRLGTQELSPQDINVLKKSLIMLIMPLKNKTILQSNLFHKIAA